MIMQSTLTFQIRFRLEKIDLLTGKGFCKAWDGGLTAMGVKQMCQTVS